MGALPRLRLPPAPTTHPTRLHPPPTRPPPIESIRDITGTERKTSRIQIASRVSYEMVATYINALFMQDI